jgi:hypothetical protein
MRVAVLALLIAAVGLPATARAQRCVRVAGGMFESPGCRPPAERAGDKGEARFWQEKFEGRKRDPAADMPLVMPPGGRFPSTWPLPRSGTREGATTLDDLDLKPDGRGGYRGQRPGFKFDIVHGHPNVFAIFDAVHMNQLKWWDFKTTIKDFVTFFIQLLIVQRSHKMKAGALISLIPFLNGFFVV